MTKMTQLQLLELAVRLQRRLIAYQPNIHVGVLADQEYSESSIYIKYGSKARYNIQIYTEGEIVELAKALLVPTYINIKTLCANIFDQDVYAQTTKGVFKLVKPLSLTHAGVTCEDGWFYSQQELFIKE